MDNGTRHQLREEGYKQQIFWKRTERNFPSVSINQIGDLLERVKADAERQNDVPDIPMRSEKRVAVIEEETGVLKISEQTEVE